MPVNNDGVGYSECTPYKLKHLTTIFQMHFKVTGAVFQRNGQPLTYRYIDATAGPGYCPDSDHLKGSPVVFLDTMRNQLPFRADFIEENPGNYASLRQVLGEDCPESVNLHRADYRAKIPELLDERNDWEFGLVFVDENGIPDFDTLAHVSRLRPKMEQLIYLPATAIKRCLSCSGNRLEDYLSCIQKKYWLIREPMGKWQWTFLLGSNTDLFRDYKRIGFFRLDSERGQEVFNLLNLTNAEREHLDQCMPPMQNISSTLVTVPLGQRPLPGLEAFVNDARNGQSRKSITCGIHRGDSLM